VTIPAGTGHDAGPARIPASRARIARRPGSRARAQRRSPRRNASIEFRPVLAAQHDHAATHGQPGRQQLFAQLLNHIDDNQAS
jgi:hypothetical protein